MHLNIGCYDGHVISLGGMLGSLKVLNNFQAVGGSIRSMARAGKYLLVGAFDQIMHIYDIENNAQVAEINCQQGVVNKISVVGDMVITGGEDGSVMVWKMGTWERIYKAKEHKSIETMNVHPSGKVMITSGKEKKLAFWNLLKFMRVMDIKLSVNIKKTLFYGDSIILVSENSISLLDTVENTVITKAECKSKIQDALISNDLIITSHQNGQISFWSAVDFNKTFQFCASKVRVKCLGMVRLPQNQMLVSGNSEGQVKIWHLPSLIAKKYQDTQKCVLMTSKFQQRILCMEAGLDEDDPILQKADSDVQEEKADKTTKKLTRPKKIRKQTQSRKQQKLKSNQIKRKAKRE